MPEVEEQQTPISLKPHLQDHLQDLQGHLQDLQEHLQDHFWGGFRTV